MKNRSTHAEFLERRKNCRISAALNCTDNIYEQMRVRIVRVMREHNYIQLAAEKLGVSENTIRRYMRFVPFEHLMRDPGLENRFDWRSMTCEKWTKLLRKHPQFISRLPKKLFLYSLNIADILIAQPQLAPHFNLKEWNDPECPNDLSWSKLLSSRPELAAYCDLSVITAYAVKELLCYQPQFFDRLRIDTMWPYHWSELFRWQPQLEKKMNAKPHSEWPFNYWVYALQVHPELEPEFDDWDKIASDDIPDFKREQPEMYARHWSQNKM